LEENDEEELKGNNDGKKQSGSSSMQMKLDPEDEVIALKHAARFDGFIRVCKSTHMYFLYPFFRTIIP